MPTSTKPVFPVYFTVRVVDAEVVGNRDDVRHAGLPTSRIRYVDRDARLNTGPEGTRLDTAELAQTFLVHALPAVRARHGAAVDLQVTRGRATSAMSARWVYQNSWQIRAILGIAEPPPLHLRGGPTG